MSEEEKDTQLEDLQAEVSEHDEKAQDAAAEDGGEKKEFEDPVDKILPTEIELPDCVKQLDYQTYEISLGDGLFVTILDVGAHILQEISVLQSGGVMADFKMPMLLSTLIIEHKLKAPRDLPIFDKKRGDTLPYPKDEWISEHKSDWKKFLSGFKGEPTEIEALDAPVTKLTVWGRCFSTKVNVLIIKTLAVVAQGTAKNLSRPQSNTE